MSKELLSKICISENHSVSDAIAKIEESGGEVALVVDNDGRLKGTITDGDVRRGILSGISLDDLVPTIMNETPKFALERAGNRAIKKQLEENAITQLPILDEDGIVTDIVFLRELQQKIGKGQRVVIMAGGLGTRLKPITDLVPKPMIPIGGRPILEIIVEHFKTQGFVDITLSVNYLSEIIKKHFGDGSKFGVDIQYVEEGKRLGTAGALSLIDPVPTQSMIVMNGDVLTSVNFDKMLDFHARSDALATMGLNQLEYKVPYGVVDVAGHSIKSFQEKPTLNFFVNSGVYIIDPEILSLIPKDEFFDMPMLFEKLPEEKRAAFPIHEYWTDIGQPSDLNGAVEKYSHLEEINK